MIIEISKVFINKYFTLEVYNYLVAKGYEGFVIELKRPPKKENGKKDLFSGIFSPALGQHWDSIHGEFVWTNEEIFIIKVLSIERGTSLVERY